MLQSTRISLSELLSRKKATSPFTSSINGSVPTTIPTSSIASSEVWMLVWASYTTRSDQSYVIIYGRNQRGEKRKFVFPYDPYFYVESDEFARIYPTLGDLQYRIKRIDQEYIPGYLGKVYTKVTTKIPADVTELRSYFSDVCEAGLKFEYRFLVDHKIKKYFTVSRRTIIPNIAEVYDRNIPPSPVFFENGTKHRIAFYDIETLSLRGGFSIPQRDPIFMVQLMDSATWDIQLVVFPPDEHRAEYINTARSYLWTIADGDFYDNEFTELDEEFNLLHIKREWGKHPLRSLGLTLDEFVVKPEIHIANSEQDIFRILISLQKRYQWDVWTGWYSKFFDMPYLVDRAKQLGLLYMMDNKRLGGSFCELAPLGYIQDLGLRETSGNKKERDLKIGGLQHIDMLEDLYKKFKSRDVSQRSWDLKDCVANEAGFFYYDWGAHMHECSQSPYTSFNYGSNDVFALRLINKVSGCIDSYEFLCNISGVLLQDSKSNKKIIELGIYRIAHDWNVCIPWRPYAKKVDFEGAYVHTPPPGLHRTVMVYDYARMYPDIVMAHNIDPLTKTTITSGTYFAGGFYFRKDIVGIIPYFCQFAAEGREVMRRLRLAAAPYSEEYDRALKGELAFKATANSVYGVMGFVGFCLYDADCALAVTAQGQELNKILIRIAEQHGYRVIYSDTDSAFVQVYTLEEALRLETLFQEELNAFSIQCGSAYPATIKAEKYFTNIIFLLKKKKSKRAPNEPRKKGYSGHLVWKEGKTVDILVTMGLPIKRSDYSLETQWLMKNMLELIVRQGDENGAFKLLQNAWNNLSTYDPYRIGKPKALKKGLGGYSTANPFVEGVFYAQKWFGRQWDGNFKPLLFHVHNVKPLYCSHDELLILQERVGRWNWSKTRVIEYREGFHVYPPLTPYYCLISSDDRLPPEIEIAWNPTKFKSGRKKQDLDGMKMMTIISPLEPLLRTLGYDINNIIKEQKIKQGKLETWFT